MVLKRARREVDHSSLYRAEVKNEWSHTSTPPTCLHGADRENFTFLYPMTTISISVTQSSSYQSTVHKYYIKRKSVNSMSVMLPNSQKPQ